jgi:hypothetical protein
VCAPSTSSSARCATRSKASAELLIVGPKTGITDFEHYAKKHRAQTAAHIVGTEVTDHPSEGQLVAMARKYFLKYDRMAGTPTPS